MKLSNLKLNIKEKEVKTPFGDIKIKDYLPIDGKIEMINLVVENSMDKETGIVNRLNAELLFQYLVIKLYTDIELNMDNFTEEYDILESNGIIDIVFSNIPKNEIETLIEYLEMTIDYHNKENNNLIIFLDKLSKSLENKLQNIFKLMDEIDLDKYKDLEGLMGKLK